MSTAFHALVMQDPAPAPAPAPAPQGRQPDFFGVFGIPMILILVLMYFMMIRPQRKQMKERDNLLSNLKKNDHVMTSAGMYGIIDRVGDNDVTLKVDERNDVKIRVAKGFIATVVKASGEKAADDKAAEK